MKKTALLPLTLFFLVAFPVFNFAQENIQAPRDSSTVTDVSLPGDLLFDSENKILLGNQLDKTTKGISECKATINKLNQYISTLNTNDSRMSEGTVSSIFMQNTPPADDRVLQSAEMQLVSAMISISRVMQPDEEFFYEDGMYSEIVSAANYKNALNINLQAVSTDNTFGELDRYYGNKYSNPSAYYNGYYPDGAQEITGSYSLRAKNYAGVQAVAKKIKSLQRAGDSLVMQEKRRIYGEISAQQQLMKLYGKKQAELYSKLSDETQQLSNKAISVGIPFFSGTIIFLFLGSLCIKLWGNKNGRPEKHDSQGVILAIGTVFLLTTTILILGLAGQLSKEVLGTLIGGISAYVLNNIGKHRTPAAAAVTVTPPAKPEEETVVAVVTDTDKPKE